MTSVVDASALLAFLQGEAGAAQVERVLDSSDAVVGSANWSETARTIIRAGGDWELARALLLGYGVTVEPVTQDDAEEAARAWPEESGLSLGDRLSLALGKRYDATVVTADRAWDGLPGVSLIR